MEWHQGQARGDVCSASEVVQCRSKGNIGGEGGGGGARERRGRDPLGGSGGMLTQKILKSRGLEMLFPVFCKSYF